MNDDELLTAMQGSLATVRDSLADVHMDRPVSAITGRARSRRLHRGLAGGAAGAVALGASLSIALSGGAGGTGSVPGRPVHVSLDAWTVSTTSTGQVDLTIRALEDQALLERTLAEAGVPAIVSFGEFCGTTDQADNLTHATGRHFLGAPVTSASNGVLLYIVVNPAAIPAGAKVTIGVAGWGTGQGIIGSELIKDGAPLTCHPFR
jgi:hypothetical protein